MESATKIDVEPAPKFKSPKCVFPWCTFLYSILVITVFYMKKEIQLMYYLCIGQYSIYFECVIYSLNKKILTFLCKIIGKNIIFEKTRTGTTKLRPDSESVSKIDIGKVNARNCVSHCNRLNKTLVQRDYCIRGLFKKFLFSCTNA